MAAADIGANFSNYTGNAGLGAIDMPAIKLDTNPLRELAQYTFYYKRDEWRQRQQETDAKVKELADLSTIALNNLRGKDKEQMVKEFSDLQNYAAEYARKTPKNAQERMQNELEWQSKYGAFKNNYGSGKTRAVTYQKRFNDIMGGTQDAKTKDAELEILNKEFQDTDIGTTISAMPKFKIGSFEIPNPTAQTFTSVGIGANENVSLTMSYYNPSINGGVADAAILGFKKSYPKEGTIEYSKLTQNQKDEAKVQSTIEGDVGGWVAAVEPVNAVLKNYVKDGVFDATSFENDNANNTTIIEPYRALKRLNEYSKNKFDQTKSFMFADKGLNVKLPENVKADDFRAGFVDFAKGVNANQLVQSGMFAKFTGDKIEKKITETDNQIQRDNLAVQWYNAKTSRKNAEKPSASEGGKMPDLVTQPALLFGEHINRIKKYFDANDNELTVGYTGTDEITRKALGLQEGKYVIYRKDGTAIVNTDEKGNGGTPLTIEQQKNNFIIAVKGGTKEEATLDAKFLADAETGIQGIFGTTSGKAIWDNWGTSPTKTTVTEEVKVTDINSLDPNGFKKEGKNYRYKDGTLYDAKGNIVK